MIRKIKVAVIVLAAVTSILIGSFILWAEFLVPVMSEAKEALVSDEQVTVTRHGHLDFETEGSKIGLIYYPGGRVEADAYGPFAKGLAAEGINVYLPSFPLDLAVFGINRAETIIKAHPDIEHWYIGGHSLGGVMASEYYRENMEAFEGLIFYASYPSSDLSSMSGKVLVIYGSEDGLCLPEDVNGAMDKLPASAEYDLIEGANHSQFGYYGFQKGDNPAVLNYEEQLVQMVSKTVAFISQPK